jgi:SAM-dependent methyltransferase
VRETRIDVYAPAQQVATIDDCSFYHTVDLPGFGQQDGMWDLRPAIDDYLGRVNFKGLRVLEVGTADGFIAFHMERAGAEVVACDLSPDYDWDVVPFAGYDHAAFLDRRKADIQRLNNAFWLSHRLLGSSVKMVYCDAYSLPAEIGEFDVCTFGSILLHLRDPFLALQRAADLTTGTIIVTDVMSRLSTPRFLEPVQRFLPAMLRRPAMRFLPEWRKTEPRETWWVLSPQLVRDFVGVLGFEATSVIYHTQLYRGRHQRCFTVVGRRTRPRVRELATGR